MSSSDSNTSPRQLHIPPELIHHIIDNCDEESLSNCSLVSRTWHSITGPHLYRHISWFEDEDENLPLSDLFIFLDDGTHLARHVKSFAVIRGRLNVHELIRLFHYFPHLQNLTIIEAHLTPALAVDPTSSSDSNPPTRPSLPRLPIPHLRMLDVQSCHILHNRDPWSPLFDLINSFSVIDRLYLDSVWSRDYPSNEPPLVGLTTIAPKGKSGVGDLIFLPGKDENVDELVACLMEHVDVTQIHTLMMARRDQHHVLNQMMALMCNLRHFSLLMTGLDAEKNISLPASTSSLESIAFSIVPNDAGQNTKDTIVNSLKGMIPYTVGALSSISRVARSHHSPHPLSTVRYELFCQDPDMPGEVDKFGCLKLLAENVHWSDLESALSERSFGKLQVVEMLLFAPEVFLGGRPTGESIVEYCAKESKEQVILADLVKSRLPKLTKRCKVNVDVR